jgi:hypothetical protein
LPADIYVILTSAKRDAVMSKRDCYVYLISEISLRTAFQFRIRMPLVSMNRGVLNRLWFDFWMLFVLWLRFQWGYIALMLW